MKNQGANPYSNKFSCSHSIQDYICKYDEITKNGDKLVEEKCKLAGRVMSVRKAGKKLIFYTIKSNNRKLQVMANCSLYKSEKDFYSDVDKIKRGDHIGVTGFAAKSKVGELSIIPYELELLAPCTRVIPEQLENKELRDRQRYLDTIVNKSSYEKMLLPTKLNSIIRDFFNKENFNEVSTPILSTVASGAAAKPFQTFQNDLKMNLYNRVSPELRLKEMLVGGFDRVFEIGKVFRNESADKSHNPEFTICEAYKAYSDYHDLMHMTEELFSRIFKELRPKYNLVTPFERIDMIPELEKQMGVKLPDPQELHTEDSKTKLLEICQTHSVSCPEPQTTSRMLDKLCDHFIVKNLTKPTFITNHPHVMSPLAKESTDRPGIAERFELYMEGMELVNCYTEQNDPQVQSEMFLRQVEMKELGDEEAVKHDEEFCVALEYGLPPCAGWGLGVDRLLMLLTDSKSIRDVLYKPLMKEEKK